MEEFMSPQTFDSFLMFKVTIAIVAAYYFCKFSQRDATAFDTIYRKRIRYVYVVLIGASVVWSLIQIFKGPFAFSLPFYNMSVYGTAFPTEAMLETGIGVNANVHFSYETCRWSRLTFEQWNLSTGIADLIVGVGLLIYIFRYRRSSVRWNVKIRKFIGYILLYVSPATIAHSFHYFSLDEFSVVAIYIGITYLCCRTYNWDAVPAKLPKESISHPNVPEFEAIPPEDKSRIGIKDYISISKEDVKEDFQTLREKVRNSKNTHLWLLGLIIFFLIATLGLWLYRVENRPSRMVHSSDFHVWIDNTYDSESSKYWWKDKCGVDNTLGEPINGNECFQKLRENTYWFYDNKAVYTQFCRHEIVTYDISKLGYKRSEKSKYLDYVAQSHHGRIYNVGCVGDNEKCVGYGGDVELASEVYVETDEKTDVVLAAGRTHGKKVTTCRRMNVYVQVFCEGKYAYEVRTYTFKGVDSSKIINHLYFKNPYRHTNNLLIACAILLTLSTIALVVYFAVRTKKENYHTKAKIILWYTVVSMGLQILLITVWIILGCIENWYGEDVFIVLSVLALGILFINIPSIIYVWHRRQMEPSLDFLFPSWYKDSFVCAFANKEVCTKLSLALIFYPIFYIATLPGGVFALIYIFPMIIIFGIVYLINWIFKDNKQQAKPFQKKEHKQIGFAGDTLKEKLQLLKSMLDEGLITQEDYDRKKAEILDKFQD